METKASFKHYKAINCRKNEIIVPKLLYQNQLSFIRCSHQLNSAISFSFVYKKKGEWKDLKSNAHKPKFPPLNRQRRRAKDPSFTATYPPRTWSLFKKIHFEIISKHPQNCNLFPQNQLDSFFRINLQSPIFFFENESSLPIFQNQHYKTREEFSKTKINLKSKFLIWKLVWSHACAHTPFFSILTLF